MAGNQDDEDPIIQASINSENDITKLCICIIKHPFDYAKTLIQIGYEPLPSFPTRTIFGTPKIGLPGALSYLGFVIRQEGVTGIFRGLPYHILHQFTYRYTYRFISESLKNYCPYLDIQLHAPPPSPEPGTTRTQEFAPAPNLTIKISRQQIPESHQYVDFTTSLNELGRTLARDGLCLTGALTVSYPIHVLLVRNFASFVGKETVYEFPIAAIKDIIKNEGILGLYSGFIPKLIGDLSCLVITNSIVILLIKPYLKQYEYSALLASMVNFVVPALHYPFNLVSNVMAVNGCKSLEAAKLEPEFIDWMDCWRHLTAMGNIKRGSSIIWRYRTQPISLAPQKPSRYNF